jgi:hypothetical protein
MASLDDLLQDAAALSLSAPPGSSVSFASPVAAVASPTSMEGVVGLGGVGGNIEGTGVESKRSYTVVLVPTGDRSMCFGLIGIGSGSFCIRKDCRVKSHAVNKMMIFDSPMFFISRVDGSTVFAQPAVMQSKVPSQTQAEWNGKQWPLSKWVREFRAISNADNALASSEDIKTEVKLLDEAEAFRTPSKKRKSQGGLSEPLSIVSIPSHQRTLPEEGDRDLDAMIEGQTLGRGGLTRIVSRLETSVVEMGRTLEEVTSLVHGRFVDNEASVNLVSGAVQNLMSTLGSTMELDTRFEAPTLWGTASFIGEEVARLGEDVDKSKEGVAVAMALVKDALGKVSKVEDNKTKEEAKMIGILTSVMRRVQGIGPELEAVKLNIAKLGADVEALSNPKRQKTGSSSERNTGYPMMDDLMSMLATDNTHRASEGSDKDDKIDSTGGPFVQRTEDEFRRVSIEIGKLVREVAILKASTEDKSIKFGGLGLRDLSECNEWVKARFATLRYGLVMDPLLMLDRIFGSDDMDGDSQFKILESRVKLKIKTGAEAAAIKALHFNRPRLFHKGRVAMTSERNTSKLSKLPTYKSWKSGGEGVMNYVIKQMNLIYSTVCHDIEFAFGSDPEMRDAKAVTAASLNATVTFLTQLMGFIDALYQKLHSDSKFSGEQAWSLTTQILDRVCEDMYAPKEGVAEAMTIEDPSSICSHLLWACFRTHDVMKTYLDHHFENHPAISAEYVKFLATNSGFDKVEKMELTVAAMKEKVDKAIDSAEKAGKKADAATDKFSAANKELEYLKKRVQGLDNKAK